jgi:cellulose synthase/poly-beta-1,6-N-acetylglucosamine synthase-like glycosyltransferase
MTGELMHVGVALAAATFVLSLAVCVYIYFGYPALIFVLSRLRPRPVRRGPATPTVTVIVPVFNEEPVIEAKIRNSLELDYPAELLEVLIVSDGSTDGTEELVRHTSDTRVHLLSLSRCGKAFALNAGAESASGEILVLTDANTILEPGSLRTMVECFADPEVGGVCGIKSFVTAVGGDTTHQGEGLYWRYDNWQKQLESRIGSIFAADGSLYAVRRHLYVPIDDPAQADDIAISTRVVLQGRRLIFEPRSVAYEVAPEEGKDELRRKVRVTNHSVRALLNLGADLWRSGFYSVELLSHKLVRHLIPFFLIPLFLSNLALAPAHPFLLVLLILQIVFYALAGAGFLLRHNNFGGLPFFSIPYYFSLVNTAAFLGVLSTLTGRRLHAWTPRSGIDSSGE